LLSALGVFRAEAQIAHEDPRWVSVLAGLVFLLGGGAVIMQGAIGGERSNGELPPATPRWLRLVYDLIVLTIIISLGAIASWVAFGQGERHFTGSGSILGETGGRAMFGLGAILIWIGLGVAAFMRLRQAWSRSEEP
jgi:hypothetical protein